MHSFLVGTTVILLGELEKAHKVSILSLLSLSLYSCFQVQFFAESQFIAREPGRFKYKLCRSANRMTY